MLKIHNPKLTKSIIKPPHPSELLKEISNDLLNDLKITFVKDVSEVVKLALDIS